MSSPKFNVGDKIRTKYQIEELPAGTLGTVARVIHNSLFEVIFSTKRVNCYDGELEHAAKPTMTAMQVANGEFKDSDDGLSPQIKQHVITNAGTVTRPKGAIVYGSSGGGSAPTYKLSDMHDQFWGQSVSGSWVSEEDKKKRKEEGRCETCGELRPMDIWGLGDCPVNSEHTTPAVKQ